MGPRLERAPLQSITATCILLTFGLEAVYGLSAAAVSLYLATTNSNTLEWNNSPQHLLSQILSLGYRVNVVTDGQANLAALMGGSAYVVPAQTNRVLYSHAEDMEAIAEYIQQGGLVILLDACHDGGQAQKLFISTALRYSGDWSACRTVPSSSSPATLNHDRALEFLPHASWPSELEEAASIEAHANCYHSDIGALTWPLYSYQDDATAAVAQAFGKRGTRGAVVWLGYSWRDGPKGHWGDLIRELVEAFHDGGFQSFDDLAPSHLFHADGFERFADEVANIADATSEIVRRFLQGTAPAYPPSPQPPSPSPSPSPPEPVAFVKFKQLLGMGVFVTQPNKSVVWFDDADFRLYRKPRNHVNLVFWSRVNECNVTYGICTQCPRAWQADTTRNVTILFREPWQLDAIHITQLQNPGVLTVELLPWPAVPGLSGFTPNVSALSPPIRNVTVDKTKCGGTLRIPLGDRAGTRLRVLAHGSQDSIPPKLQPTTLGGVNIIVKEQPTKGTNPPGYTFIESVRFDGRVLYPNDPALYGPDHP